MNNEKKVSVRLFEILELIAFAQKPLTFSDIVACSGLAKSTVHRFLKDLESYQYIHKNSDNLYTIGIKCLEIASYYIDKVELKTEALPYLSVLQELLNLTVMVGTVEDNKFYYSMVAGYKRYTKLGYEMPIYCSALSKVLLSSFNEIGLKEILYENPIEKYTKNTISSKEQFCNELKTVRREQIAFDNEEYQIGKRCVAVPVFNYTGNIIAAIGIIGETEEVNENTLPTIIKELRGTAKQISRRMGYTL